MFGVGGIEHAVSRAGIFVPTPVRLQVHRAQLPLAERVFDARSKPAFLLFLSDLHPIFNEDDSAIYHVLLCDWTELQKFFMLLRRAKSHHLLNAGAVIPTAVENDDFTRRREMLHVTLDVHLGLFTIGGRRQRKKPKHSGTDAFCDCANGTTLAGCVAAFKDDNDAKTLVFDPVLKFAKLGLQPA